MTSTIQLHSSPAAGFDEPFELLAACHGRVERMLTLLSRLEAHLPAHGADEQARQAAVDVMRYFDVAAPHHHEDEERHVFPLLEASGDVALAALARSLRADHVRMVAAWQVLRGDLRAIAEGRWPPEFPPFERWHAFAALYSRHAAEEDGVAFPAARDRLDAAALKPIGDEMARRRGL